MFGGGFPGIGGGLPGFGGGGAGGLLNGPGGLSNMPMMGALFGDPEGLTLQQEMAKAGQATAQYRPEMAQARMNAMRGTLQALNPYNSAMAMMYGGGFQQLPQIQNPMTERMMTLGNPMTPDQMQQGGGIPGLPGGGQGGFPGGLPGGIGGGSLPGGAPTPDEARNMIGGLPLANTPFGQATNALVDPLGITGRGLAGIGASSNGRGSATTPEEYAKMRERSTAEWQRRQGGGS